MYVAFRMKWTWKSDAQMPSNRDSLHTIFLPIHQHRFKLQMLFSLFWTCIGSFRFPEIGVKGRVDDYTVLCAWLSNETWNIFFGLLTHPTGNTLWCSTKYWWVFKVFLFIILPQILRSAYVFSSICSFRDSKSAFTKNREIVHISMKNLKH